MAIDTQEKISITQTGWTAQVSKDLSQCCDETLLNFWYEKVFLGEALAFEVVSSGRLGTVIVSINDDGEMLIGPMGVTDYPACFEAITPKMYELAELYKVKTVRVNADRIAVQRFLEPHNFKIDYVSFVKDMGEHNGQ